MHRARFFTKVEQNFSQIANFGAPNVAFSTRHWSLGPSQVGGPFRVGGPRQVASPLGGSDFRTKATELKT